MNHSKIQLLLFLICGFLLTGCADMDRLKGLQGDNEVLTSEYDIRESDYFQSVERGRTAHKAKILTALNERAEEVKEENKEEHTSTTTDVLEDGTVDTTTEVWYEYPDVEVILPEPPFAPAMAYLQLIDENILKGNRFLYDEAKVTAFYERIRSEIIVEGSGMSFSVRVEYLPVGEDTDSETPQSMVTTLFPSSESEYRQHRQYFMDSTDLYRILLENAGYVDSNGNGYNPGGDFGYTGNIAFDESIGGQASSWAVSKVGCSYSQGNRFGATSFDCSSLMYRVYKPLGIDLAYEGMTTAAGIAKGLEARGCQIGYGELAMGDLIFYSFSSNGRYKNITHVAMYIGNGKIVHARSTKYGVRIDDVSLYSQASIRAIARPSGLK